MMFEYLRKEEVHKHRLRMPRAFAMGGLLKQAGDRSGAPPERGPNSQGLLSLMKRGMKI